MDYTQPYLHKFCPIAAAWLCVYPQVPFFIVDFNFLIQKAMQSTKNLGKFPGVWVHNATLSTLKQEDKNLYI